MINHIDNARLFHKLAMQCRSFGFPISAKEHFWQRDVCLAKARRIRREARLEEQRLIVAWCERVVHARCSSRKGESMTMNGPKTGVITAVKKIEGWRECALEGIAICRNLELFTRAAIHYLETQSTVSAFTSLPASRTA